MPVDLLQDVYQEPAGQPPISICYTCWRRDDHLVDAGQALLPLLRAPASIAPVSIVCGTVRSAAGGPYVRGAADAT